MKYIYIDGGARIGESVEIILDKRIELIKYVKLFY